MLPGRLSKTVRPCYATTDPGSDGIELLSVLSCLSLTGARAGLSSESARTIINVERALNAAAMWRSCAASGPPEVQSAADKIAEVQPWAVDSAGTATLPAIRLCTGVESTSN